MEKNNAINELINISTNMQLTETTDFKTIAPFASRRKEPYQEGKMIGALLIICDREFIAWNYDTYIYEAISIAKTWKPEEVTFKRILHMRTWIRENIQHGHNLPTFHLKTMEDAKQFIDELIKLEYQFDDLQGSILLNNSQIFS